MGFAPDASPVGQVWAPANSQDIHDPQLPNARRLPSRQRLEHARNDQDITHPGMNRAWFFRRAEGHWQWTVSKVADGQSPSPNGGICQYHGGGPP